MIFNRFDKDRKWRKNTETLPPRPGKSRRATGYCFTGDGVFIPERTKVRRGETIPP